MQTRSSAFYALIIVGVLLIIGGLVYGLSSRQTSYQSVPQGTIAHYLTSGNTGYLEMEGSSALYVVQEDNFTPTINGFADGDSISFVYDPGATSSIDVTSTLGTHLSGTAAKIVEVTAVGTSSQMIYKTPEYTSNAQGYNHNQWGIGIALMIVGLLLVVGSFFVPRRKAPAMITTAPYAGTPSYGQPPQQYSYPQQGAPQYPQQLQYPQYPQQPTAQPQPGPFQQAPFTGDPQLNSYEQPNPYAQPQQPDPYGQPNPYGQPAQPNQGQYPNPYGQPPQQ